MVPSGELTWDSCYNTHPVDAIAAAGPRVSCKWEKNRYTHARSDCRITLRIPPPKERQTMFFARPISLKTEVWDRIDAYMNEFAAKNRDFVPNRSAFLEEA